MKQFIFTAWFALVAAACSPQPGALNSPTAFDAALIGGEPVASGSEIAKSVVMLRFKSSGQHLCTGTLIKKKMVLTAAHCLFDASANGRTLVPRKDIEVVFSTSTFTQDLSRVRQVRKVLAHPEVNQKLLICSSRANIPGCENQNDPEFVKPTFDVGILIMNDSAPSDTVPLKVVQLVRLDRSIDAILVGGGLRIPTEPKSVPELLANSGRLDAIKKRFTLGNAGLGIAGTLYETDQRNLDFPLSQPIQGRPGDSGAPLLIQTKNGLQILGVERGAGSPQNYKGKVVKGILYNNVMHSRFWIDPLVNSTEYD